jgi:hypothetical protein
MQPPGAAEITRLTDPAGQLVPLVFRGRMGIHGDQEIRGEETGPSGVGVFSYHNAPNPQPFNGQIPFEFNVQIDRLGPDVEAGRDDATELNVQLYDHSSGQTTSQTIQLESRQTTFFTFPVSAITGPDYDLIFTCNSSGHIVGLFPTQSLQLVVARHSFESNLFKSLAILWMMSILVLCLAILCSTFLSWPVAIVLTIVLLLAKYGVDQLADVSGPGLGSQIVNDFKFNDAPVAKVVSTGVDTLTRGIHYMSLVLPDTTTFDAISSIEQGVGISADEMRAPLGVMLGFGLPAVVLAYVVLRGKEVAP